MSYVSPAEFEAAIGLFHGLQRVGRAEGVLRVAVSDPICSVRRALSSAFYQAGFEPYEPPNLEDWVAAFGEHGAVVLALLGEEEHQRMTRLRGRSPECALVALVTEPGPAAFSCAFRAGAWGVVSRDACPEEITAVLVATCIGRCLLPVSVAQFLAFESPPIEHPLLLSAEVTWLSALLEGATVAEIARKAGYSEREMFRRLASLYDRMGVASRAQALLTAGRWGLL